MSRKMDKTNSVELTETELTRVNGGMAFVPLLIAIFADKVGRTIDNTFGTTICASAQAARR